MVVDPPQSLSEHMLEGGTVTRTHSGLKDLILLPQPLRAVCARCHALLLLSFIY